MVTQLKDYLDKVKEKYPFFSKSDLSKIILFGFRRYIWANQRHADVLLKNRIDYSTTMHCGPLGTDTLKHYKRFVVKWRMKERALYKLSKQKWDGYYYIGLPDSQQKALKKKGNKITFTHVFLTKVKKELYHDKAYKHIWKVPWPVDCGWRFYREKLTTEYAEYLGENPFKYYQDAFQGKYKNEIPEDQEERSVEQGS